MSKLVRIALDRRRPMPMRIIDMMPVTIAVMMMRGRVIMVRIMNMRLRAAAMAMICRSHGDALVIARVNASGEEKSMPRPGIEPGPKVPETFVMSFSLPGRKVDHHQYMTAPARTSAAPC